MFLHVFRHVEPQQLNTQRVSQLLGNFCFANTRRTSEQVVADGFLRLTQASAREFDRGGERVDSAVLTKDHPLERRFEVFEYLRIVFAHVLRWDARDLGHHGLDFLRTERLTPLGLGNQMLCCTSLVNHVDGFVRQLAIIDVPCRQLDRRFNRIGGVFDAVMFLEIGLEAL